MSIHKLQMATKEFLYCRKKNCPPSKLGIITKVNFQEKYRVLHSVEMQKKIYIKRGGESKERSKVHWCSCPAHTIFPFFESNLIENARANNIDQYVEKKYVRVVVCVRSLLIFTLIVNVFLL